MSSDDKGVFLNSKKILKEKDIIARFALVSLAIINKSENDFRLMYQKFDKLITDGANIFMRYEKQGKTQKHQHDFLMLSNNKGNDYIRNSKDYLDAGTTFLYILNHIYHSKNIDISLEYATSKCKPIKRPIEKIVEELEYAVEQANNKEKNEY